MGEEVALSAIHNTNENDLHSEGTPPHRGEKEGVRGERGGIPLPTAAQFLKVLFPKPFSGT